jgi:hypothetical protein
MAYPIELVATSIQKSLAEVQLFFFQVRLKGAL